MQSNNNHNPLITPDSSIKPFLIEYRCTCRHLLFKGMISAGSRLEIKCKRCAKIVSLSGNIYSDNQDDHFVLILGTDGKILEASPSVENALGYTMDEIKNMSITDIAPLTTVDAYRRMYEVVKRQGHYTFLSDSKFKHKNGRDLFLRSKFKLHQSDGVDNVIVFYKIVGSSLTFEFSSDAVRFESPHLQVCELVLEISTTGDIVYVSRKLVELLGVDIVDMLGISMFEFIDETFAMSLKKDLEKMVNIQRSFIIPNQVLFKNNYRDRLSGEYNIFFTPLYHPDNSIKGFKVIIRPSVLCSTK